MAKIITNSSYFESIERANASTDATSLSKMNVVGYRTPSGTKSSFEGFSTVLADIEKENKRNLTINSLNSKNQHSNVLNATLNDNLAAMERYDSLILGHPTNYKTYFNDTSLPRQATTDMLSNLNGKTPKANNSGYGVQNANAPTQQQEIRNLQQEGLFSRGKIANYDKTVPNSKANQLIGDNDLTLGTGASFKQAEGSKSYLENTVQKHSDKIREYLSSLVKKDFVNTNQALNNQAQTSASVDKKDEIRKIIKIAGQYHGLDPTLALAVAKTESSLRPDAVSKDGHESKGIFQLLDGTAANMIKRLKVQEQYQPFDPKMNSHLGVGYLRYLHDIFSNDTKISENMITSQASSREDLEKLALAAYNAGEGNVIKAQEKAKSQGENPGDFDAVKKFLPEITRGYVVKVSSYKKEIGENSQI